MRSADAARALALLLGPDAQLVLILPEQLAELVAGLPSDGLHLIRRPGTHLASGVLRRWQMVRCEGLSSCHSSFADAAGRLPRADSHRSLAQIQRVG